MFQIIFCLKKAKQKQHGKRCNNYEWVAKQNKTKNPKKILKKKEDERGKEKKQTWNKTKNL